jgi:uncharacterized membrane protein
MEKKERIIITCIVCKENKKSTQALHADLVRNGVQNLIKKEYPKWNENSYICFPDLNHYRAKYMKELLKKEKGELSKIEKDVVTSLEKHEILSKDINKQFEKELTLGEKLADKVATFGGSWRFILLFGGFLVIWIIVNTLVLLLRPFDPYPFILLNLILSSIAALQAPVIMMSQNRQEEKDRLRSEEDYKTNLKAELMIRHLNTKMDQLLSNQWQRLLEIQQLQLDLLEQSGDKISR